MEVCCVLMHLHSNGKTSGKKTMVKKASLKAGCITHEKAYS